MSKTEQWSFGTTCHKLHHTATAHQRFFEYALFTLLLTYLLTYLPTETFNKLIG